MSSRSSAGGGRIILIWYLGLHVVDCIRRFNFKSNHLPNESLGKHLHTTVKTQNEVEGRLMNVVVCRHSQASCPQKLGIAVQEECPPYLEYWPFMLSIVSEDLTLRVIVLTKICMLLQRWRTRWRVDSF